MSFPGLGNFGAMPAWQPSALPGGATSLPSTGGFTLPVVTTLPLSAPSLSSDPFGISQMMNGVSAPQESNNITGTQLSALTNKTATLISQTATMLNAAIEQLSKRSPLGLSGVTNGSVSQPVGAPQPATQAKLSNTDGKSGYKAKASSYYPDNSALEGGYYDMGDPKNGGKARPLYTLQDYLAGKAPYVSVAMSIKGSFPYDTKLKIPELEKKYGRPIEFRVVDNGGHFNPSKENPQGLGKSAIDICTKNEKTSKKDIVNGYVTLIPV